MLLVFDGEDIGVDSLDWQFVGADDVFLLFSAACLCQTPSFPVNTPDSSEKKCRAINLLGGGEGPNFDIERI